VLDLDGPSDEEVLEPEAYIESERVANRSWSLSGGFREASFKKRADLKPGLKRQASGLGFAAVLSVTGWSEHDAEEVDVGLEAGQASTAAHLSASPAQDSLAHLQHLIDDANEQLATAGSAATAEHGSQSFKLRRSSPRAQASDIDGLVAQREAQWESHLRTELRPLIEERERQHEELTRLESLLQQANTLLQALAQPARQAITRMSSHMVEGLPARVADAQTPSQLGTRAPSLRSDGTATHYNPATATFTHTFTAHGTEYGLEVQPTAVGADAHTVALNPQQEAPRMRWAVGLGGCCVRHRKAPSHDPFGTPLLFGLLRLYNLITEEPALPLGQMPRGPPS